MEKYEFIEEKIKRRPIDKKKVFRNLIFTFILAALFGVVSSAVFVFLRPKMESVYKEQNKEALSLDISGMGNKVPTDGDGGSGNYQGLSGLEVIDGSIQMLAKSADKFLVNVTAITSEVDWFQEVYEFSNQATGIIIGKSQEQLLILTNRVPLIGASSITVTFEDGAVAWAEEISYDTVTNLSVISVVTDELSSTTMTNIQEASFGSADSMGEGNIVLAVGAPLGYSGGVVYGHLITKSTVSSVDNVLDLLLTDVVASTEGSGVLLNTRGQIIGIISQERADSATKNLITATSIDSLQVVIEKLMNGDQVGYVGIEGATITPEIAERQSMSEGIYVTKVKKDSPAMNAGIQCGDIIFKVNAIELSTVDAFHKEILNRDIGETVEVYVYRIGKGEYNEIIFDVKLGGY